jgi:hypothetical protein
MQRATSHTLKKDQHNKEYQFSHYLSFFVLHVDVEMLNRIKHTPIDLRIAYLPYFHFPLDSHL